MDSKPKGCYSKNERLNKSVSLQHLFDANFELLVGNVPSANMEGLNSFSFGEHLNQPSLFPALSTCFDFQVFMQVWNFMEISCDSSSKDWTEKNSQQVEQILPNPSMVDGLGLRQFSPKETMSRNADLLPWFWEAQSRHPHKPVSPSLSLPPSLNCHQPLLHPEYRRRPAARRLGDNKTHLRSETGDNQRKVTIKRKSVWRSEETMRGTMEQTRWWKCWWSRNRFLQVSYNKSMFMGEKNRWLKQKMKRNESCWEAKLFVRMRQQSHISSSSALHSWAVMMEIQQIHKEHVQAVRLWLLIHISQNTDTHIQASTFVPLKHTQTETHPI